MKNPSIHAVEPHYLTRGVPDQQVIIKGAGFPRDSTFVKLDSEQGQVSLLSDTVMVIKNLEVVYTYQTSSLELIVFLRD